jgi:glycosyltransferase involved in cell wall biosynthesis
MIGGAEKQAQLLAKKLMESGIVVDIVTGCWKFGTSRKARIDGIRIVRNFTCWGMFGVKGVRTLGALIYMFTLALYLLVHRREYDIVHVHQALYPAFISVLIGKQILRKPVLVKTSSSGLTSDSKLIRRFPLGKFQLRYLLKKMDCLVTVSRISGKEYQEIGFPESKIVYIPNGVEVPSRAQDFSDGIKCVVSTSRLSEEKGIDVLLRAWANLVKHEIGLQLTIMGYGPLESDLKGLIRFLEIENSVEFTGRVENVKSYLTNAQLFILPSRSEGLSNALLEAMSYGIPCIATKVGGNGELLGGEGKQIPMGGYMVADNGLLVNPDDPKGLSEAIRYLIHHTEVREVLGRRSRKYVEENYSIDLIAEKYINLYRAMLSKRV